MRDVSSIATFCEIAMPFPCAIDAREGYHAGSFSPAPTEGAAA